MTVRDVQRRIILLGSTGSIGTSTLEVVDTLIERGAAGMSVVGLAAGRNVELLQEQARRYGVEHVATAADVDLDVPHAYRGADAARQLVEAIAQPGDVVVAAIVGSAGLPAVIAAIERGCDIALANKETLVAAGSIVMPLAAARGVRILPVDSEHSAIFQCVAGQPRQEEIRRIVLTASGGPFRTWNAARMQAATVDEALAHPTWRMGRKVTIDSATLMNKALELIEARWLFDVPLDRIEAIVHPQSIVHGLVEFVDGSVIAQLGAPDMRVPIQVALTWPERHEAAGTPLDWTSLSQLEFEPVDETRFPAIRLARAVMEQGGSTGAIFNAANEVAVEAFLDGRLSFGAIMATVEETLGIVATTPVESIEMALDVDQTARRTASAVVERLSGHRSDIRVS